MKAQFIARNIVFILCLGVVLSSGCAKFIKPEIGAVARPEARISLSEDQAKGKPLETKELNIAYTLSGTAESFTLSGYVLFDRSLINSFPVASRFFLKMSFLDGEGRVIETADITPVFNVFGTAPEKMAFKFAGMPPAGSKAIAFNYFGIFRANPPDSSGNWEIYYFPFD